MYTILNILYIELKWTELERGVYCIYKACMYSIEKTCTVGCIYNINNSNLNNVRGSACARMGSATIKVLRQCSNA